MGQVPVGPAASGSILIHTGLAGLQGVVGSKATGQNSKAEFEVYDAVAGHGHDGILRFPRRNECRVVREQRAFPGNIFCSAEMALGTRDEISKTRRQVVLAAGLWVAKELLAGPR